MQEVFLFNSEKFMEIDQEINFREFLKNIYINETKEDFKKCPNVSYMSLYI